LLLDKLLLRSKSVFYSLSSKQLTSLTSKLRVGHEELRSIRSQVLKILRIRRIKGYTYAISERRPSLTKEFVLSRLPRGRRSRLLESINEATNYRGNTFSSRRTLLCGTFKGSSITTKNWG
jgi:hypothetical protein